MSQSSTSQPSTSQPSAVVAENVAQSAPRDPAKILPVSWDQFHRDSRALAWRLTGAGPFEAIVCITRGGLVPAAIVARELGVPCVVNTGTGSRRIRTGDRCRFDGKTGTITILQHASNGQETS